MPRPDSRPIWWKLNEQGEPVPATTSRFPTPAEYVEIEQTMRKWANFRVGREPVRSGTAEVSTVFLAVDHAISGPPILWETALFSGTHCKVLERCSGSREQAEAMHAKWVRVCGRVKNGASKLLSRRASGDAGEAVQTPHPRKP